jgi:thiol peroxidase
MANSDNSKILFKGAPATVEGPCLRVGGKLPKFKLTGLDLNEISSADFVGQVIVISVIPSIDTPVCSLQTKAFNRAATELSKDVKVLTVSVDLPFAQKRWCGAEGVENLTMASDYKNRSFGRDFGCLLPDLGLLCRAVFVANREGQIAHVEYVEEIASEPDYNLALTKVRELL